MKNKQENDFEALSGAEQVLRRPGMWAGSMQPIKNKMFMIGQNGVEYKEVTYIPAFRKIIDEILDNSLDALIEHANAAGSIKVEMTDDSVYIEDDGPGIPVVKKTLSEVELKNLPKEEAAIPLPRLETTPPVTKMNLVFIIFLSFI